MDKKIYIDCDCHSEGLILEKEEETGEVYLSIFEIGSNEDHTMTWKQRIRSAWRILRKGSPYGDQIVLSKKSQNDIVNFLNT